MNPLKIQIEYAKHIDSIIYVDLKNQRILNKNFEPISVLGQKIFLRSTCENILEAIDLLKKNNALLLEDEPDIHKIERWDCLPIVKRQILSLNFIDIITQKYTPEVSKFLQANKEIFIKSRKKGFCISVSPQKILDLDGTVVTLLNNLCLSIGSSELILCKKYDIKSDSIGKIEARFFVFNSTVVNSSRYIHSLHHSVPKKLIIAAEKIVEIIKGIAEFPTNYVLDVAEFIDHNNIFIDTVELNPISTSMCYVNNSIFKHKAPSISEACRVFSGGYEYCYDYIKNKENYVMKRCAGENFEYKNPEYYIL